MPATVQFVAIETTHHPDSSLVYTLLSPCREPFHFRCTLSHLKPRHFLSVECQLANIEKQHNLLNTHLGLLRMFSDANLSANTTLKNDALCLP